VLHSSKRWFGALLHPIIIAVNCKNTLLRAIGIRFYLIVIEMQIP
jgi:hypothetical protein